jgi:hypothetical protein
MPGSQWNCSQTIPCNFRLRTRFREFTTEFFSLTKERIHLLRNIEFPQ